MFLLAVQFIGIQQDQVVQLNDNACSASFNLERSTITKRNPFCSYKRVSIISIHIEINSHYV